MQKPEKRQEPPKQETIANCEGQRCSKAENNAENETSEKHEKKSTQQCMYLDKNAYDFETA